MYVRLAFAVAAHLEPEILIVDEVLAVGDAEFQKKCLGKMEDVSTKDGRTVILVSHQMPAIQNLCTRCILMDRGRLLQQGPTDEIVNAYMMKGASLALSGLADRDDRTGKGDVRVTEVNLRDESGNIIREAISGNDVYLSLSYSVKKGVDLQDCIICAEVFMDLKEYFSLSSAMVDPQEDPFGGRWQDRFPRARLAAFERLLSCERLYRIRPRGAGSYQRRLGDRGDQRGLLRHRQGAA